MNNTTDKQKKKYFAEYIYEEDSYGITFELFAAETPAEKWKNDLRWTMAISVDKARNNIKAKIKNKLGYTWQEVQRIGMKFGPVKRDEYIKKVYGEKNEDPNKYINLWTSHKDSITVNIDNCTAVKEESLFTVTIPVMDVNLQELINNYKYGKDNWILVDEKNIPLCAFAFKENAEVIGNIMKRRVVRLYIDKSLW